MRLLSSLTEEALARRFADHLLAMGIDSTVEPGRSGHEVWVHHDDHMDRARQELGAFLASPDDPRYQHVAKAASGIRAAREKRFRRLRQNFTDVRTSWGAPGGGGQTVTLLLIVLSGIVGAASNFARKPEPVLPWLQIASVEMRWVGEGQRVVPVRTHRGLEQVRQGQVWRLVTPIFVHIGVLHFVFNMFWLWDLGRIIEGRKGPLVMAMLVLAAAVVPNLLQYAWAGPDFGGMSGVLYALFGYIWMKGRFQPHEQVRIGQSAVTILLLWLVLCMTGWVGPVANAAHLAGLVVGTVAGYAPYAWVRWRRGR